MRCCSLELCVWRCCCSCTHALATIRHKRNDHTNPHAKVKMDRGEHAAPERARRYKICGTQLKFEAPLRLAAQQLTSNSAAEARKRLLRQMNWLLYLRKGMKNVTVAKSKRFGKKRLWGKLPKRCVPKG